MSAELPTCTATVYPGEGHISVIVNHDDEIVSTLTRAAPDRVAGTSVGVPAGVAWQGMPATRAGSEAGAMTYTRSLVRAGILVLPLGAALKMLGNLGTFDSVGYGVPQASEAATVTAPVFVVGELVGSVVPVLLTPFGVFALFAFLLPYGRRWLLTAGLVCTVVGAGMTLTALGVVNYALPALGTAYRNGDRHAMDIADSFFTWPRGAMIYPAILVPIGAVLFAVAMWRSRAVPGWVAALFAFSTVLLAVPVPLHAVRLAGAVLGLAAGVCVAVTVRRTPRTAGGRTATVMP